MQAVFRMLQLSARMRPWTPSTESPAAGSPAPLGRAASLEPCCVSCEMKIIYWFALQGHQEGRLIVWHMGTADRMGYGPANPLLHCCAQCSRSTALLRGDCRLLYPEDLSCGIAPDKGVMGLCVQHESGTSMPGMAWLVALVASLLACKGQPDLQHPCVGQ